MLELRERMIERVGRRRRVFQTVSDVVEPVQDAIGKRSHPIERGVDRRSQCTNAIDRRTRLRRQGLWHEPRQQPKRGDDLSLQRQTGAIPTVGRTRSTS